MLDTTVKYTSASYLAGIPGTCKMYPAAGVAKTQYFQMCAESSTAPLDGLQWQVFTAQTQRLAECESSAARAFEAKHRPIQVQGQNIPTSSQTATQPSITSTQTTRTRQAKDGTRTGCVAGNRTRHGKGTGRDANGGTLNGIWKGHRTGHGAGHEMTRDGTRTLHNRTQ